MIYGTVSLTRIASADLRMRGPSGSEAQIRLIIDTGYTGLMTLPPATVALLGLRRHSGGRAVMADGSVRLYPTYTAEVLWGTSWRSVVVDAIGNVALLGMAMLDGHDLHIRTVRGGVVEITPIP